MTPASVMKRFKANGASRMSDFHRASLKMAWLPLCRITNESTAIENCYYSLNRELRWLWNSVYKQRDFMEKMTGHFLAFHKRFMKVRCRGSKSPGRVNMLIVKEWHNIKMLTFFIAKFSRLEVHCTGKKSRYS